jgi:uncharacterized protein (UPF0147 family)
MVTIEKSQGRVYENCITDLVGYISSGSIHNFEKVYLFLEELLEDERLPKKIRTKINEGLKEEDELYELKKRFNIIAYSEERSTNPTETIKLLKQIACNNIPTIAQSLEETMKELSSISHLCEQTDLYQEAQKSLLNHEKSKNSYGF